MSVMFGEAPKLAPSITLLINGTNYTVESPRGDIGLRYTRLSIAAARVASKKEVSPELRAKLVLDDSDERMFIEDMLGDTLAAMVAGGVQWPIIQHAAATTLVWISYGVEAAVSYWQQKAPAKPKAAAGKARSKKRKKSTR